MTSTPGLSPEQLTYSEFAQWKQLITQAATDMRCASAAFLVEDLDPVTQTVTVQIAIQERARTPNGQQWWDVPPIIKVPILVPRGGGYSITLPLKKGDQGMLIFCDTCFDLWWLNGQTGSPPAYVSPTTQAVSGSQRQLEVRRHHVHDCGFFPGMWSQNNLIPDYSNTSLQIRADDSGSVIDVSETGVTVTGVLGAGLPLALVNDNFYQWFVTDVLPFLITKGYAGPTVPLHSETVVLKGQ